MSHSQEMKWEEEFKWGSKRMRNVPSQFPHHQYSSFIFKGVTYRLYDCIVMDDKEALETYIGKIVRMWESPYNQEKKVEVVWFYRPVEIAKFLGDYKPSWNELFLASGKGEGVSTIIDPENIVGKRNVICLSDDKRNVQPPPEVIREATYYFTHVFDVGSRKVLKTFPNAIDYIDVEAFFNQSRHQERANQEVKKPLIGSSSGGRLFF